MTIDIEVKQAGSGFYPSSEGIAAHTRLGLERAWWMCAKDIHKEFNRQVLDKSSKTGKIYYKKKNRGRVSHQASAPLETPANITGVYRKSFDFNVRGAEELAVGIEADYGKYLELGTSRMEKRPGLANSIKASERDIIRNLATEIENYI